MQSQAKTVKDYLAELPDDRRAAMETVRRVIRKNLPKGYEETMLYGMIGYVVPLKTYPVGYLDNPKMPVGYIALASQKNYMSLYLINDVYPEAAPISKWFTQRWKDSGKKLNMGKSCLRFKSVDDLALDVIGELVTKTSVKEMIAMYEKSRKQGAKKVKSRVRR